MNLTTYIGVFAFQLALWGIYTPIYKHLVNVYSIYRYSHLVHLIFY